LFNKVIILSFRNLFWKNFRNLITFSTKDLFKIIWNNSNFMILRILCNNILTVLYYNYENTFLDFFLIINIEWNKSCVLFRVMTYQYFLDFKTWWKRVYQVTIQITLQYRNTSSLTSHYSLYYRSAKRH